MIEISSVSHEDLVKRMTSLATNAAREVFDSIEHPEEVDGTIFEDYCGCAGVSGRASCIASYLESTPIAAAALDENDVIGILKMEYPREYPTQEVIDRKCREISDEFFEYVTSEILKRSSAQDSSDEGTGTAVDGEKLAEYIIEGKMREDATEWANMRSTLHFYRVLRAWTTMRLYAEFAMIVVRHVEADPTEPNPEYERVLAVWKSFNTWCGEQFGEYYDDGALCGLWKHLHGIGRCSDCPFIKVLVELFIRYLMVDGMFNADPTEVDGTTIVDLYEADSDAFYSYLRDLYVGNAPSEPVLGCD